MQTVNRKKFGQNTNLRYNYKWYCTMVYHPLFTLSIEMGWKERFKIEIRDDVKEQLREQLKK